MEKEYALDMINLIEDFQIEEDRIPGLLIEFLKHPDEEVRINAAHSFFSNYEYPELLEKMMEVAKKDPSLKVRGAALNSLGRILYEGEVMNSFEDIEEGADIKEGIYFDSDIKEVTPYCYFLVRDFLMDVIHNKKEPLECRRRALEAFQHIAHLDKVNELIEEFYNMKDCDVKVTAIFMMGFSSKPNWTPIILNHLEDKNIDLQREAIRSAGRQTLKKAKPILKKLIRGDNIEIAGESLIALAQILPVNDASDLIRGMAQIHGKQLKDAIDDAKEILEERKLFSGFPIDDDFSFEGEEAAYFDEDNYEEEEEDDDDNGI